MRATQRVFNEARVIFSATAPTTAATLASATFHLLSNPGILRKLKTELEAAIPDVDSIPTLRQVESLPYLVRAFSSCLFSVEMQSLIAHRTLSYKKLSAFIRPEPCVKRK
jgi:cytochrome P450